MNTRTPGYNNTFSVKLVTTNKGFIAADRYIEGLEELTGGGNISPYGNTALYDSYWNLDYPDRLGTVKNMIGYNSGYFQIDTKEINFGYDPSVTSIPASTAVLYGVNPSLYPTATLYYDGQWRSFGNHYGRQSPGRPNQKIIPTMGALLATVSTDQPYVVMARGEQYSAAMYKGIQNLNVSTNNLIITPFYNTGTAWTQQTQFLTSFTGITASSRPLWNNLTMSDAGDVIVANAETFVVTSSATARNFGVLNTFLRTDATTWIVPAVYVYSTSLVAPQTPVVTMNFRNTQFVMDQYAQNGILSAPASSATTAREFGQMIYLKRVNTAWSAYATLLGTGGSPASFVPTLASSVSIPGAGQGYSMSINRYGEYLAVGAPNDNDYRGAVWIFKKLDTTWTQQTKIAFSVGGAATAGFGYNVDLSADASVLAVQASTSTGALGTGELFIFNQTNSTTWTQQKVLQASNSAIYTAYQTNYYNSMNLNSDYIYSMYVASNQSPMIWRFTRHLYGGGPLTTWAQAGPPIVVTISSASTAYGLNSTLDMNNSVGIIGVTETSIPGGVGSGHITFFGTEGNLVFQ